MNDKQLYEEWKANTKYSPSYTQRMQDQANFEQNTHNFFGDGLCPKRCCVQRDELSQTYLKQLKMSKGQTELPLVDAGSAMVSMTMFNNLIMKETYNKMSGSTGAPPKLTTAKSGNMNVTLREGSDVWRRQTYMAPNYREDLLKSTNRADLI